MTSSKHLAGGFLIAIGLSLGFGIGSLRAAGAPQTQPLFYTGTLTEGGDLVTGQARNIHISLWNDAESTATSNLTCETIADGTPVEGGRFRVALDPTCVGAVHDEPEQWVEIAVDGTAIGSRAKLGAVPYALEAERAANAPTVTEWMEAPGVVPTVGTSEIATPVDNQTTEARYRRVGDSIELLIRTEFSATPTATSGVLRYTFPDGIAFDEGKLNRQHFLGLAQIGEVLCKAHVSIGDPAVGLVCDGTSPTLTTPVALSTASIINVRISFPVEGWATQ